LGCIGKRLGQTKKFDRPVQRQAAQRTARCNRLLAIKPRTATLLVLKVEELLIDIEQKERQFPDSESTLNEQVRNGRAINKEDCDRPFLVG
jgi:hypothetical protein